MEAIGKPELADDPRFLDREPRAQNYDLLHDICQEVFATDTRDHWVQRLRECGVPSGPLNTIPEVLEDPQVKNWGLPIKINRPGGDTVSITGSTVQLSETPPTFGDPPLLGEHNEEVFKSLGYSDTEIAALAGQLTV
jgi:crotonobetainyl-CoA:carnitine CoA-transferase CaiB-like acyl-CoA transferase